MSDFSKDRKIRMINFWRKRCGKLQKMGIHATKDTCKECDKIALEICDHIEKCSTTEDVLNKHFKKGGSSH